MKIFSALLLSIGLLPGIASAQVVTIGTNAQGSLAYIAGAAISRVATSETDLTVRTQALSGSTSFIPMLDRGEVTFGFSSGTEFIWAYTGTGTFEGRAAENLRYVGMIFPLRSGVAVAADSGIDSLTDLREWAGTGKRIATGYPSLKTVEEYLGVALESVGVSFDDFVSVPVGGLTEGVEALGDGRVDITWISFGSPAGRQVDAGLSDRGGWRYLNMVDTPEGRERWQASFPGTSFVTLNDPAQPGIREAVAVQELPFMMVTHQDTPEDVVYAITKVIAENQEQLAEIMPNFRALDVQEMALPGGLPYHDGAVRAYEELGIPVNQETQ